MSPRGQPAARSPGPPGDARDPYQLSLEHRRAFTHFIAENLLPGHHGPGQSRSYIPLTKLREFWTPKRIGEVLGRSYNVPYIPQIIRDSYLRVFSALIFIGQVPWLTAFTEAKLDDWSFPCDTIPNRWPADTPLYKDMWEKFSETQWMFFPQVFDPRQLLNSRIHDRCILPLNAIELLGRGGMAELYKIEIHEAYNKLLENSRSAQSNTFVLKTYTGERYHQEYNNEKSALMALQSNPSEHIVTYYGSFQQGDRRSLILEYVDGGNLLEFMRYNRPPTSQEDIHDFWTSLVNVLQGVFRVHQITNHDEHAAEYRIVHEDLKPDNILLQKGKSKFKFRSKIADFGCSHIRSVNRGEEDRLADDQHGHPTYSAPETTHHQRWMETGPNRISSAADIWSMGCILSEVAAWVVLGEPGRQEYAKERRNEIRNFHTFKGSNYSDCFHNGSEALVAVRAMHDRIAKSRQPSDNVTPDILDIVEKKMLVWNPVERWEAKSLMERFQQILAERDSADPPSTPEKHADDRSADHLARLTSDSLDIAEKLGALQVSTPERPAPTPLTNSRPLSGSSMSSGGSANSPPQSASLDQVLTRSSSRLKRLKSLRLSSFLSVSSASSSTIKSPSPTSATRTGTPQDNYLSISDVINYREDRKNKRPVKPRVDELIGQLRTNLSARDHIFFIEDSVSMEKHIELVQRTFVVLSYLAKQIDTNDIELVFSSRPSTVHKNNHTTPLIEKLEQHKFEQVQGMMENHLGEFIEKNIVRRLPRSPLPNRQVLASKKPISIFIFTDGCWGPDLPDAAGVENPIRNLMEEINKRSLNRTQVMIQFIRFGDDPDGKRYLKILDDFGQPTKNDIVDTRPVDGNVYAMFIGSLNQSMDNMEDDAYEADPSPDTCRGCG